MVEAKYKILIPTAGVGQKIGELTKHTNKALVRIGKKPVLSHIIEAYPEDIPLVIPVGHFAEHIKDFIELAYPNRKIEFVEVDKYKGEGSSVGYSMLSAQKHLQCPFIYHACDTIVTGPIPAPDHNWIGGSKGSDSSHYASWDVVEDKVTAYKDRGAVNFDYLHIGLVGIKDFAGFWSKLEQLYDQDPNNSDLNDGWTIADMLKQNCEFKIVDFPKWYDAGNTAALQLARSELTDKDFNNLDKYDESIYIFDERFVIKFFSNPELVAGRVARAKILSGLVPEIESAKPNFYKYRYEPGELYSRVATASDFKKFLHWSKKNLWKPSQVVSDEDFKQACLAFYRDKTLARVQKFTESHFIKDQEQLINDDLVPSLSDLLETIDWNWLASGMQHRMHGDFILDNIIKKDDDYCLLDWRHEFGGLTEAGDIYYDFAKLNHNLTVNHEIIDKNLFLVHNENGKVKYDIMSKHNLGECQKILMEFLELEGYDVKKTKLLTALVWLNMAPLHHHPFNTFLYHFGRHNLWKALNL